MTSPITTTVVSSVEVAAPRVAVIEIRQPLASLYDITGKPGPTGPVGPAGTTNVSFQHEQTTPATVWQITHELGYDPAGFTVVATDGYVIDDFGIQYLVAGASLRLSFDIAIAGVAYLS